MSDAERIDALAEMPTRKLLQAGFRPLSRFAIMVSSILVLDPARRRKAIVPRRPVALLSMVKGISKPVSVSLRVTTGRHKVERGAISVSVEFFGLLGRPVAPACRGNRMRFFADPIGNPEIQALYFDVPKGAFWAKVTLCRHVKNRRIGIEGSLRPRRVVSPVSLSLEDALVSRDRRALEYHLAEARLRADRQTGRQVLARFAFLERTPDILLSYRLLEDCDRTITGLAREKNIASDCAACDAGSGYQYTVLFNPYSGTIALSKWLKSEAISLKHVAGTVALEIPSGTDFLLRVLVARSAGLQFRMPDTEQEVPAFDTVDIPWIKSDEVLSI